MPDSPSRRRSENRADIADSPLSRTPEGRRLQRLSRLMDSAIALPGGYRIGWDGLIGLVPGIGDMVGLGVSAWIVLGAARMGAPKALLARMAGNVALESLVGVVPVLGDLFDFAFKANMRNMRLLERHALEPQRLERRSRLWLLGASAAALALVLLIGWAIVALIAGLLGLLS